MTTDRDTLGFVGVGAMGFPIASAILDAGYGLTVFDANAEAVDGLEALGAKRGDSVRAVADEASIVFLSLPTPAVVSDVALGEEGLGGGESVRICVDLSTTGPVVATEVANGLEERGVAYLDAPVSGGVVGAEARTLTAMVAGEPATFETVRQLLDAFTAKVFWVGAMPGQGQLAKLLNNLLSASAMAITSEAMALGIKRGLDPGSLLEIFNASSGRNTATSDKFPKHVLTRRFAAGFRMALMAKDVELCLAMARDAGAPMLVGGAVQQVWSLAASQAEASADHTELVRLYEAWSGVSVAAGSSTAESGP